MTSGVDSSVMFLLGLICTGLVPALTGAPSARSVDRPVAVATDTEAGDSRGSDGAAAWILPAVEAATARRAEVLTTEHYRFYMPEHGGRAGETWIAELERFWRFYEKTIASLVPTRVVDQRVTVVRCATPAEFVAFRRASPGPPDGERRGVLWRRSPPMVAFDGSAILGPSDRAVLFFAVAHAGHQILLYEPGVAGSWWLREGLAGYFMQTRVDRSGRFVAGDLRDSEGYIRDVTGAGRLSSGMTWAEEPRRAVKSAVTAYRKKRQVPVDELLDLPADHRFDDVETRRQAEIEAWILVHFLLHGGDGELRPRPAAFLARERQGEGGVATFRRTVSGDLDRFESFLYRHARRMK
ncbi:MAG: hypothetical protein ACE5IK_00675 [Acidobacteriota bacterium]